MKIDIKSIDVLLDNLKATKEDKPLLVAGSLIALENNNYREIVLSGVHNCVESWLTHIKTVLYNANMHDIYPVFEKLNIDYSPDSFHTFVSVINNLRSTVREEKIDLSGRFYANTKRTLPVQADLVVGSSLDDNVLGKLQGSWTKGLLNPPYSQAAREVHFMSRMLDVLEPGGVMVAVVPLSAGNTGKRRGKDGMDIMSRHTLEASMSLPNTIFHPVGVYTCLMVWRAHVPHNSNVKTWFSLWKDDGFRTNKKGGRIDKDGKWASIRSKWIENYRNKKIDIETSAYKTICPDDEWCAEACVETDYSKITPEVYKNHVLDYMAYLETVKNRTAG